MVKNFGGCKQKKQGRKFLTAPRSNKLRFAEEDEEMYGCVSKMLGNGMAHVVGIDGAQRLLIIRNKFRGRGKRDNTLRPGTIVLIGNRDWETSGAAAGKLDKCDLLEVYNDSEYTKLKDKVLLNWNVFKNVIPDHNATVVDDEVSFGVEDEPDETIIKEIHAEMESGENHISLMIDDELVDFDDI